MKRSLCLLLLLIFALNLLKGIWALTCYSCQGGPATTCAQVTALGSVENCDGANSQCYEALVQYQNGALTLVQRRCWQPPKRSNQTDFCKAFNNPNGKLGKCITCKTDNCNTDKNFWK